MNIVKVGGSILFSNGKYNHSVLDQFANLIANSSEKFIFVIGGGEFARFLQKTSSDFLANSFQDKETISLAADWLGIAGTKVNAEYVRSYFTDKFKNVVHPQILIDPAQKIAGEARIFVAAGNKPGFSTDTVMMMFARTFKAHCVFKLSDFGMIKDIASKDLVGKSDKEKELILKKAKPLPKLSWNKLQQIVGYDWTPGLKTPFDPVAVHIGISLKKIVLYVGKFEEFSKMLNKEEFMGTIVQG